MNKQILKLGKPIVDRFPKLALTYRLLRDSVHLAQAPRDTPMGFQFNGNPAMQERNVKPDETRLIETIFPSLDVVINVEANIEGYCCIAPRQRKHVVALEPVPLNLRYLPRKSRANGWDTDIEVFPLALGDRAGIVEIYGGATGASLVKG